MEIAQTIEMRGNMRDGGKWRSVSILRVAAVGLLGVLIVNCVFAQLGIFNRGGAWVFVVAALAFGVMAVVYFGGSVAESLCVGGAGGVRGGGKRRGVTAGVIGVIGGAMAVYLGLFYTPSDRIFGACDEGLYVNTAVNLAATGHYHLDAPVLSELTDGEKAALLKSEPAAAQRGTKLRQTHPRYHIGLFLRGSGGPGASSELTPQFPLGWPVILASSYSVGGWKAVHATNTVILFLCAIVAGMLAMAWFGPVTALCVFLLFLFFPLHPWAARSLFSEPALELAWLLAVFGWREGRRAPVAGGLITGLAAGALLYLKIEASLVVSGLVVLWAWHWRDRRKYVLVCMASGLVSLTLAASAWMQFNQFYLADTFGTVPRKVLWAAAAVLAGIAYGMSRPEVQEFLRAKGYRRERRVADEPRTGAGVAVVENGAWVTTARVRPAMADPGRKIRIARNVAFWVLLVLMFFGACIRPEPATPDSYFYWPVQKEIRSYREETFLRLIWYWQPWGLALAGIGAASMVYALRHPWQIGLYGVGLFFLIGLGYDVRNNPIQPYAMRRLLPFAMPILIYGAALIGRQAVALWVPRLRRRPWMAAAAQVTITATLLAGFIPMNGTLNRHVEFAGAPEQIEKLAAQLPPNALVLVSEGSLLSWLATPLQFIYGRECMIVPSAAFGDPGFPVLVERWAAKGHPAFLLTEKGGVRWFSHGTSQVLNPTGYESITTSYLFQSPSERPEHVVPFRLNYHLIPLEAW